MGKQIDDRRVTSARSGKRRSVQQSFGSDYANPVGCKLKTGSRSRAVSS
jgi:hypothetical protein